MNKDKIYQINGKLIQLISQTEEQQNQCYKLNKE